MRLTREEFINAIEIYKRMIAEEEFILNSFDINPEWTIGRWIAEYLNLLNRVCDLPKDEYLGTILDTFCFDMDFGTYNVEVQTAEATYRLDNPGALYDFIMLLEDE